MKKSDFVAPVTLGNCLVESSFNFSALEIDLFVKIAQYANKSHYAQIELFYKDLLGDHLGNSQYLEIKKGLRKLMTNPVELFNPETNTTTAFCIISGFQIINTTGRIYINIDLFAMLHLYDLKKSFTMIELQSLLKLDSKYSKRLYLVFSKFRSTEYYTVNIDELKRKFCINGMYPVFADFYKRIIKNSLAEINAKTELKVELRLKSRQRQAISTLSFSIELTKEIAEVYGDEKQIEFMIRCGLAQWQIENAISTKTASELRPVLYKCYLRMVDKAKPAIINKGAYLCTALEAAGINMKTAQSNQLKIE